MLILLFVLFVLAANAQDSTSYETLRKLEGHHYEAGPSFNRSKPNKAWVHWWYPFHKVIIVDELTPKNYRAIVRIENRKLRIGRRIDKLKKRIRRLGLSIISPDMLKYAVSQIPIYDTELSIASGSVFTLFTSATGYYQA